MNPSTESDQVHIFASRPETRAIMSGKKIAVPDEICDCLREIATAQVTNVKVLATAHPVTPEA